VSTQALESWLSARLPAATASWFAEAMVVARSVTLSSGEFAVRWSGCGRRLGRSLIDVDASATTTLQGEGSPFVPGGWGQDEAGRALLLLAAAERTPAPDLPAAIEQLFRTGEMREQQAILRVLACLPEPARFAAIAAEAVRSNVLSVLEALTCDNPFPAAHMPEPAFNQMIMKAIFNGLPLRRVRGLSVRLGAELRRMVSAYASERRAAGRAVPADVDFVLQGAEHASV
jgi:hypothetical protein